MPYPIDLKLARQKMHQAEKELQDYMFANWKGSRYDPEYGKQLITAATRARSAYIDQLEMPDFSGLTPTKLPHFGL